LNNKLLHDLAADLEGELLDDKLTKSLYATDASVYRKIPVAVALPKTKEDIKRLIRSYGTTWSNTGRAQSISRTLWAVLWSKYFYV